MSKLRLCLSNLQERDEVMDMNIITVKTALSTSLFLGGAVLSTPTLGAEIDDYTSSVSSSSLVAHVEDSIVQPMVSFDCNFQTEISFKKQDDAEILGNFADSMLKGMKNLDADISKWVDDNFWDLI